MNSIVLDKEKVPICPDCKAILSDDCYGNNSEDWTCDICDKDFYESQIDWCKIWDLRKANKTDVKDEKN